MEIQYDEFAKARGIEYLSQFRRPFMDRIQRDIFESSTV
jgi:hypothetical protein